MRGREQQVHSYLSSFLKIQLTGLYPHLINQNLRGKEKGG